MLRRAAASLLPQSLRQFGGRVGTRLCSSEPAAGRPVAKSILDAAEPASSSTSAAHQAVGAASEAYMQRLQQEAAMEQQAAEGGSGAFRRVTSLLFDAMGLSLAGAGAFCGYLYYKYDVEELEETLKSTKLQEPAPEMFSPVSAWIWGVENYLRVAKDVRAQIKKFTDPPMDRLLPDMVPELRGKVKTLVLDLEDVLVHKEWTRAKGWQIYKRPGASDFLYQMAHYFELVIYTDETNMYAAPVIDRLDTHKIVNYKLYRSETQYHEGKHVRDLSKLNRNLSHVLFVSANPEAWAFQPENTLKLKPWHTDASDTTLLDLVPFLQMVSSHKVDDVRDVVKAYDDEDDVVTAFKQRVHKVAEQQKATNARGRLAGMFR